LPIEILKKMKKRGNYKENKKLKVFVLPEPGSCSIYRRHKFVFPKGKLNFPIRGRKGRIFWGCCFYFSEKSRK
jgi:hypothetical protein